MAERGLRQAAIAEALHEGVLDIRPPVVACGLAQAGEKARLGLGHAKAPEELILDLDATEDPLHGHQEGRFFRGYYDCHCYLPLYIFCGDQLLGAKLRRSDIDASAGAPEEVARVVARVRERWPAV